MLSRGAVCVLEEGRGEVKIKKDPDLSQRGGSLVGLFDGGSDVAVVVITGGSPNEDWPGMAKGKRW